MKIKTQEYNGKMVGVGYKLFEKNSEGKLFPLFIGKNIPSEMGKWLRAEFLPTKNFASRGGWHIGEMPDAPWLKGYDGSEKGLYRSRFSQGKRVWCEVLFNIDNDYSEEVSLLPKKCFSNSVPHDGFYPFREAGKGVWYITSDIIILREISEEERGEILQSMGYDEVSAYKKYKESFEKRMKKEK